MNCNILLKNDPYCLKTWKAVLLTDMSILREFACLLVQQTAVNGP